MAKDRALEFKVGLMILIAAGVLTGFIFILGNFSLGEGYTIYVDYNFSGNIQPGAPVKVSGIKVGKVEEVELWGGRMDEASGRRVQVRLKVWVEDRVKETIREDAEFFVNTAGVLGEQYLEIVPGSYEREPLAPGSVVAPCGEAAPGTACAHDPPRTDLIVARLYEFLEATTEVLHNNRNLIGDLLVNSSSAVKELNTLLVENREQVKKLLVSTTALTDESALLVADVRTGLGDPKIIHKTLVDADQTILAAKGAINDVTPRVAKVTDEGMRVLSLVTEERVERVIKPADEAIVVLGSTGTLIDNVNGMISDLRAGKGTAGALLVREELYADVKEMVRDLKRNPWKFLWKE